MARTKASFHWDDPLLLEQQLTADERAVRDAARDDCRERLAPRVLEDPEAYGGAGLNCVSCGLVAREVECIDSGCRSIRR